MLKNICFSIHTTCIRNISSAQNLKIHIYVTLYILGIKIWQTKRVNRNKIVVTIKNWVNHHFHSNAFFINLSTGVTCIYIISWLIYCSNTSFHIIRNFQTQIKNIGKKNLKIKNGLPEFMAPPFSKYASARAILWYLPFVLPIYQYNEMQNSGPTG